jgi:hypothetical protein
VAGWSLFEKRDVESLSRVVSACTIDGYKLRAKLALNFPRLLLQSEAEEVMMRFARAFTLAVENEICGGKLPFDNMGLHQRITDLVKAIPPHRVRVSGLHVLREDGAGRESLPAANVPLPPELRPSPLPSSRLPSLPAPSGPPPSRVQPQSSTRRSMLESRPSGPLNSRASELPRGAAAPLESRPAPSSSGLMSAVDPRAARSESGFAAAAEPSNADARSQAVGRTLAVALRSAAGSLLLAALDSARDRLKDPLSFFDGRVEARLQRALIKEACACVAGVLHGALARAAVPRRLAFEVAESAAQHAASGDPLLAGELHRYLALENPRDEFSARVCALLDVPQTSDLARRIDGILQAVQRDISAASERICERLLKTG